jgi:OmpA-OmpF porin, OOP family
MKKLFLLLFIPIILQSCMYPAGSGGYGGGNPNGGNTGGNTNGGNSGGNQTPSDRDRPQTYPQQTPQEPTNYPTNPQSRSGRSADKDLVVGNIRLTEQYTILYLTFTNRNQAGETYDKRTGKTGYTDGTQDVAFQQNAVLIAANGARTFKAVKTDNIPFLGDSQARNLPKYGRKLQPGESLNFVAYFERLDKGLENFDMNECNSDAYTCWNAYDLYVRNPNDAYPPSKEPTYEPPTTTDNTPTKTRTKTGKVGEVDHTPTPTPAPVVTNVLVSGIVRDVKTNRPISATIDYKLSSSKQVIDSVQSFASTGLYKMTLQKGQVYTYTASARGYLANNDIVDLSKATGKVTKDIYLTPLAVGDKITLKNIYFEVSKSDLLTASFAELNKLVTMMEDNPLMEIRLEGHTDIVGDPDANLELSQDRVDACETYIVKKGIASARIQAVGYGDTRPIVKKGTDEERKVNRRVEFVVLKL